MYDLDTDPIEMRSIYDDPTYTEVQKLLHEKLNSVREYYGDSDELNQEFISNTIQVKEDSSTKGLEFFQNQTGNMIGKLMHNFKSNIKNE
jgi:hypothetical protein